MMFLYHFRDRHLRRAIRRAVCKKRSGLLEGQARYDVQIGPGRPEPDVIVSLRLRLRVAFQWLDGPSTRAAASSPLGGVPSDAGGRGLLCGRHGWGRCHRRAPDARSGCASLREAGTGLPQGSSFRRFRRRRSQLLPQGDPMPDEFEDHQTGLTSPAWAAAAIVPSDGVSLSTSAAPGTAP
jgi:hypothetical protein